MFVDNAKRIKLLETLILLEAVISEYIKIITSCFFMMYVKVISYRTVAKTCFIKYQKA